MANILRSALLVSGSGTASALVGFIRNIALARLLSVEDFGIASTFALLLAAIELSTDVGTDKLIVQARRGDELRYQHELQAFQALRGILAAAAMIVLAIPFAAYMKLPEVLWAYQLLALIPLLKGFSHLDVHRFQRRHAFRAAATVQLLGQLVSLAVVFALAAFIGDYRILLGAILCQYAAMCVLSHIQAERPYRLVFSIPSFGEFLRFGLPLTLNGILIFIILAGDRLIVGRFFGVETLGWFAVAFSLVLLPANLANRTLQTIMLPRLAECRDDRTRFERHYALCIELALLLAVGLALAVALAGPALIAILYGLRYEQAVAIAAILAISHGLRVAKAGPAVVALAAGRTTNPLYANVVRALAFPLAFLVAMQGGDIVTVIGCAIAGELAALGVSLVLLRRTLGTRLRIVMLPLLTSLLCLAAIGIDALLWPQDGQLLDNLHWFQLVLVMTAALAAMTAVHLRRWVLARAPWARGKRAAT